MLPAIKDTPIKNPLWERAIWLVYLTLVWLIIPAPLGFWIFVVSAGIYCALKAP